MTASGGEAAGKPGVAGVYTNQRLNLSKLWEGPRKKCQGFKPDPGHPAVRDYRGASGNVSHGGNVHPSCNRKSRKWKPPTYSVARPISIPIQSPVLSGAGAKALATYVVEKTKQSGFAMRCFAPRRSDIGVKRPRRSSQCDCEQPGQHVGRRLGALEVFS